MSLAAHSGRASPLVTEVGVENVGETRPGEERFVTLGVVSNDTVWDALVLGNMAKVQRVGGNRVQVL